MSKPKLTPWFPPEVKPVHVGVYQRDYGTERASEDFVYCKWDGEKWIGYGSTPSLAARNKFASGNQSTCEWRGLANPPKEKP